MYMCINNYWKKGHEFEEEQVEYTEGFSESKGKEGCCN